MDEGWCLDAGSARRLTKDENNAEQGWQGGNARKSHSASGRVGSSSMAEAAGAGQLHGDARVHCSGRAGWDKHRQSCAVTVVSWLWQTTPPPSPPALVTAGRRAGGRLEQIQQLRLVCTAGLHYPTFTPAPKRKGGTACRHGSCILAMAMMIPWTFLAS